MSTSEAQPPAVEASTDTWVPNPHVSERQRAVQEDPEFGVVLARARAKAKGEAYKPERHGPFEDQPVPRAKRREGSGEIGDLSEVIGRFMARGDRRSRHMRGAA